jgi:hypothetical protein
MIHWRRCVKIRCQRKSSGQFSELLMTDLLVSTGRAKSIRGFKLGVAIQGRRNLTLSWEPPNRYSNEAATVRSISGEVKI